MKILIRKSISILVVIFALGFGVRAFATSGACSGHGGVDCSAGPGVEGQVICNDGWDGSSVSYAEVDECSDSSSCPVYLNQSDYTSQYDSLESEISEVQQHINAINRENSQMCATEEAHGLLCTAGADDSAELELESMIANLHLQQSCLKVVQPEPNRLTSADIDAIANQVKQMTPDQIAKSNEETCKYDEELAKNDPAGFAQYEKGMASLGVSLPDCGASTSVTPTISTGTNTFTSASDFAPSASSSATVSTPALPERITFWNRIGNLFKALKFW